MRTFRTSAFVLLVLALVASACGGKGTPTSPSGPSGPDLGTTFKILSGDSDQPVSGATVIVGGQSYTSGGDGSVSVPNLRVNDPIDVVAEGYLKRETKFSSPTITLWPNRPGFDENYTKELVYGNNELNRIWRVTNPNGVTVIFTDEMREPAIVEAHTRAAEIVSSRTNGTFKITVNDPNQNQMIPIKVNLLPALSNTPSALTTIASNNSFMKGTIDYRSKADASNVNLAVHELSHLLGLSGHHNLQGLMCWPRMVKTSEFSAEEQLALKMVMLRKPGNRFPDNDRD